MTCIVGCAALVAYELIPMMDIYSGRWGFATPSGYMAIKARYDNVRKFREGFAAVERNHKSGFINPQGQIVVKIIYDQVEDFNNGFAIVRKGNKWGAVNRTGEEIVPCQFDTPGELNNLVLEGDGKTVTIRSSTREVIVTK